MARTYLDGYRQGLHARQGFTMSVHGTKISDISVNDLGNGTVYLKLGDVTIFVEDLDVVRQIAWEIDKQATTKIRQKQMAALRSLAT